MKGIFRTDLGWYRIEVAGGRLDRSPTPHRTASRVDVILRGPQADADALLSALDAAVHVPPDPGATPHLDLQGLDGRSARLGRAELLALPGQVEDVSAHVPGREGRGVWLRSALAVLDPPPGARVILAASDGMVTDAVDLASVGDALLVHSLGDDPLPGSQGGPFRVLIPPEAGRSACANVKKLVRITLER